jgi:hypothetical protein
MLKPKNKSTICVLLCSQSKSKSIWIVHIIQHHVLLQRKTHCHFNVVLMLVIPFTR